MKSLLLALAILVAASSAGASPRIFWASDPVRPNETVMLHGSDLGPAAAIVDMARLDDGVASAPAPLPSINAWTRVPIIQGSDHTLKFVVPASAG